MKKSHTLLILLAILALLTLGLAIAHKNHQEALAIDQEVDAILGMVHRIETKNRTAKEAREHFIEAAAGSTAVIESNPDTYVYHTPTCGCCGKWISHLEGSGFRVAAIHTDDMAKIKNEKKVPSEARSCHTAVHRLGDGSEMIVEGHVPASVIDRYKLERPEGAIGLALPHSHGIGAPGMEVPGHTPQYDVLLMMQDGSTRVYEEVRGHDENGKNAMHLKEKSK